MEPFIDLFQCFFGHSVGLVFILGVQLPLTPAEQCCLEVFCCRAFTQV